MDKNKILDAAAKLVAKGAYDKAIKEYTKVLDADPKDVRVLHKLGELYEKKNDNGQAATFFTRVADGYANDGFSMKAIALYKKVLKLDPNLIEVNLKLAELHQQHQLMSEAMAYYQAVANHHDKRGDVRSSLDILKKMVDLDPDNVASRIKLAELYAREQMNPEATQEFKRAAEYLKRNNRVDDYLRVAERLSALDPNNMGLARELAQEFLNKGDQKRALAKLQLCFKHDPKDVQTLTLLAQAFEGLGQSSKTISVYKELAKIHQDSGRSDEASKIWSKVARLDPNDPDVLARAAPKPQPAPAAPAPSHPQHAAPSHHDARPQQSQQPSQSAAPAGGLSRDQLAKLLTETDVYVKYGLHDKALEHLRRVFAVDPENLDAHEKAYQIYVAANNAQASGEQLLNVLRLCTRRQEVQRAQPYLATILQQNPNHPEVPAFLQVLRTGSTPAVHAAQEEQVHEEAILVDSSDEEIIVADAPEDALADEDLALVAANSALVAEDVIEEPALSAGDDPFDAPLAADDGFGDEPFAPEEPVSAEIVVEESVFVDDEPATAETSYGDPSYDAGAGVALGDENEHEAPTQSRPLPQHLLQQSAPAQTWQPEPEPEPAAEPDVSYAYAEVSQSAIIEEPLEDSVEAPPEEEPAAEECDEAQFFLDQQLWEEAREILETVLIAFPGHARASAMMEQLEAGEAQSGAPAEEPAFEAEEAAPPAVEPVAENHSDEAPQGDEGGLDAFDLAAELASELGDSTEDAGSAPISSGDDYQVSVEEVFSEFKKGLEKIVKPEDVDTHYDLGIAYKEMGLFDDAIGEFSVARSGCVGKKKEVDCLTMMGLLYMMKGEATSAVDAFKQALVNENATPDTVKALRFELATAWESAGSPGKALFHLQAVHDEDPSFREVAGNLKRLASLARPEADPLPAGAPANGAASKAAAVAAPAAAARPGSKSGKVGYV